VDVDIVAKSLKKYGHDAEPIHGDLDQSHRMRTLEGFRDGKIRFLVASDVAARGLDIPNVSHVFNFDVPGHAEDYVHRIGRTGRAGRSGTAMMISTPKDEKQLAAIEHLVKMEIPRGDVGGQKAPAAKPTEAEVADTKDEKPAKSRSRSRSRSSKPKDEPVAEAQSAPVEAKAEQTPEPKQDAKPKEDRAPKRAEQKSDDSKPSRSRGGRGRGRNDQPMKPVTFQPKISATARLRPMVAIAPASLYLNGVSLPDAMRRPTYCPCCLATGAMPGSGAPSSLRRAVSPMT